MNINFLSPLEFQATIKRLPNVEFSIQKMSLPSLTAQQIQKPTPFNMTNETPDKVTYGDLTLSFLIDEDMKNYSEIFNWMIGMTAPQSFDQYKNYGTKEAPSKDDEGHYSDISMIMMNSHKNPNVEIKYINCFPISLSEVQMDTTQSDVQHVEAQVSFVCQSFKIIKL